MFQDLAEPKTLEAEASPVSKAATRAARLPTICSILVTSVVMTGKATSTLQRLHLLFGDPSVREGQKCFPSVA